MAVCVCVYVCVCVLDLICFASFLTTNVIYKSWWRCGRPLDSLGRVGVNGNMKTQLGFDSVVGEEKVEEGGEKMTENGKMRR